MVIYFKMRDFLSIYIHLQSFERPSLSRIPSIDARSEKCCQLFYAGFARTCTGFLKTKGRSGAFTTRSPPLCEGTMYSFCQFDPWFENMRWVHCF